MHDQCSRYCRDIQTRIENKAANVLELKDLGGKPKDGKRSQNCISHHCFPMLDKKIVANDIDRD